MTTTQAHIELVHELLSNTQYGRFGMPFDKLKSAYNRSIKKAGLKGDEAEVQKVNDLLDKKSAAERIEKNKLIPIGTSGVRSAFEQMQQQRKVDKQDRREPCRTSTYRTKSLARRTRQYPNPQVTTCSPTVPRVRLEVQTDLETQSRNPCASFL